MINENMSSETKEPRKQFLLSSRRLPDPAPTDGPPPNKSLKLEHDNLNQKIKKVLRRIFLIDFNEAIANNVSHSPTKALVVPELVQTVRFFSSGKIGLFFPITS